MKTLPGAADAAEFLRTGPLRDFKPPAEGEAAVEFNTKVNLELSDFPVPELLRCGLELIGIPSRGPWEKVAWWVPFEYKGHRFELAHQKFGLRLYSSTNRPNSAPALLSSEVLKKLQAAVRAIEGMVTNIAPKLLGRGDVTVVNQHDALDRAYRYFRERAVNPIEIPDERIEHEPQDGLVSLMLSFKSGQHEMRHNASHDLVAAMTAYLSRLEHDLVLAMAFGDFDPSHDNLEAFIGERWGEKFKRALGRDADADEFRSRLRNIVERWRNPYAHGGFEKTLTASVYLHVDSIGAVPVGLTQVRGSARYMLRPISEADTDEVFEFFDNLDGWMVKRLWKAAAWIDSGLPVRFDANFRADAQAASTPDEFDLFVARCGYEYDRAANMDF